MAIDDACTIAAASDGASVEIWNLRADKPEDATWLLPNRGLVHGVIISADGRELIAIGQVSARIWDLTNIASLPQTIHGADKSPMTSLHLPDGRLVVATSSAIAWTEALSM